MNAALDPDKCPHMNFGVNAEVCRIQKSELDPGIVTAFCCELRIRCVDCQKPFTFIGFPHGFSFYQPTVSIDGQQVILPLVHEGFTTAEGLPGYSVTRVETPGEEIKVQ